VRVDERWAAACGLVAGLGAAMSSASPTGRPIIDVVLIVMSIAFVSWAAASAHWWLLALAVGATAATVVDPLLTIVGLILLGSVFVIGARQRSQSIERVIVAGAVMNLAIRSEFAETFGVSAAVGSFVAVALIIDGLARRPSPVRSYGFAVAGVVVVSAAAASGALAVVLLQARSDTADAERAMRSGLDALSSGDDRTARVSFTEAAQLFAKVEASASSPLALPSSLVPVSAQHRRALLDVSSSATAAARTLTDELSDFDIDSLRFVNGAIDVGAVRSLQGPLDDILAAMADLQSTASSAQGPWLIDAVTERLDRLIDQLSDQRRRGEEAAEVLAAAPAMLGAEGERTYLVAFLTPAEVRGGGGFMGALAELSVQDGRVRIAEYWNTGELNRVGGGITLDDAPEEWLVRYGRYGFDSEPGGRTATEAWSNVTISPHFPSTAQVMREMYLDGVGTAPDAVFALDVTALAAVLELTGPIIVRGPDGPIRLTSDTLEQFLFIDQYLLAESDSEDLLERVGRRTLDALLDGTLVSPSVIGDVIGPITREGRLTAWSSNEGEQQLFARRHMTGGLPELDGANGFAVTFNNGNPSKIDSFLEVDIDHRIIDESDSGHRLISRVSITNAVGESDLGLPDAVVGNSFGLPRGTNRMLVDIFTASRVTSVLVDGKRVDIRRGTEAGWYTSSMFVDVPPGATLVMSVSAQPLDVDSDTLRLRIPPLARPVTASVDIDGSDGSRGVQITESGVHTVGF
jgi:hypothetical protein